MVKLSEQLQREGVQIRETRTKRAVRKKAFEEEREREKQAFENLKARATEKE